MCGWFWFCCGWLGCWGLCWLFHCQKFWSVVSLVDFLFLNVLKNSGTPIIHLPHVFAGMPGVHGVQGMAGVVTSIAHVINLSAKLLYVHPETSSVLVNVGINVLFQQSDIACAQCCRYSAALIVAKLLFVNHEWDRLDNSVKKLAFWAQDSHDIPLIEELTSDIFVAKSVEVRCHARTGVASVQTQ